MTHADDAKQQSTWRLAIETSSQQGAIALGRGTVLKNVWPLPQVRRHNVELMPTIAAACETMKLAPADLDVVCLSVGPGSFTGLRIGAATAKMLALTLGVKLVAVPTMDALPLCMPEQCERVIIGLNHKRDSVYAGVFERSEQADPTLAIPGWREVRERALCEWSTLLEQTPGPAALYSETLPQTLSLPDRITRVPAPVACEPLAEAVWRLGGRRAVCNDFVTAAALEPLYIREPEAVTLWKQRQSGEKGKGK